MINNNVDYLLNNKLIIYKNLINATDESLESY